MMIPQKNNKDIEIKTINDIIFTDDLKEKIKKAIIQVFPLAFAKGLNVLICENGIFPDEITLFSLEKTLCEDLNNNLPEVSIKIVSTKYKKLKNNK